MLLGHMGKDILRILLNKAKTSSKAPVAHFIATATRSETVRSLETEFSRDKARVKFLRNENVRAAEEADIILLSFPPDQTQNVLNQVGMRKAMQGKLIISILAGVAREAVCKPISDHGGCDAYVLRVMPSLGVKVSESANLVVDENPQIPQDLMKIAEEICKTIGTIHHCPSQIYDEMTGIAASSHALMSVVMDTIGNAAVAEGVSKDQAVILAASCLQGYASLLTQGWSADELKRSLQVPNSITSQAMARLETGPLQASLADTIAQAVQRTKSMSLSSKQ